MHGVWQVVCAVSCWHKNADKEFLNFWPKQTFLVEQQIKLVAISNFHKAATPLDLSETVRSSKIGYQQGSFGTIPKPDRRTGVHWLLAIFITIVFELKFEGITGLHKRIKVKLQK